MIVEDNADFRAYLVHEFSSDFDVVEAGDGVEGEEMVREEWPDLVISDLMMPKRDGIAFCQRMKNDIHTSHIPFILLTAKMSDDARIESYKPVPIRISQNLLILRCCRFACKNLSNNGKRGR